MTESLEERFRLQYFSRFRNVLAINWAFHNDGYVSGDCYVRAIISETYFAENNNPLYTEPMTLAEARVFISEKKELLGDMIHDCIGLQLEDNLIGNVPKNIIFPEPVTIRNRIAQHMYD